MDEFIQSGNSLDDFKRAIRLPEGMDLEVSEWCPCVDGNPGCVEHPDRTEFYTEYTISCGLCSWSCIAVSDSERDSMIAAHTLIHNILGGTELESTIEYEHDA